MLKMILNTTYIHIFRSIQDKHRADLDSHTKANLLFSEKHEKGGQYASDGEEWNLC